MRNQRGFTLSGLVFWGIIIALIAVLGMKVAPEVIDYYKIKKIVASTALNSNGKTVPEIRSIYGKYADVDQIQTIKPADLDISKDGNEVVISFAYEKRISLFGNVSLLIDFEGSSSGK
jgi:Tfp pilus assembly major pilin PilA